MAIAYSWIERAEFNPTEGITLHMHGDRIRIKCRNLNAEVRAEVRLFQGITRYRVIWVPESCTAHSIERGVQSTIVEEISW